jgi:hypothetical protein
VQITILGMMILPLSLIWASNPVRLLELALVGSIFEAGSSVVVGGSFGMPVAMIPGLMFIAYVIAQYALGMRYGAEGLVLRALTPLLGLLAYALWSIMVLPDAFSGSIMVYPQRPDPLEYALVPLAYTSGNITQTLYLLMDVTITTVAAIFLTRAAIPYEKIMGAYLLSGYIVVGFCFWNLASRMAGVPFPDDVLYSNPTFAVVEQTVGLVPRIQGPFTEPAALAFYLAGLCFCCVWLVAHGHRMMRVNLLLGLSILSMLLSTSTTGIVTLVVGLPLLLMFAAARADRRAIARLGKTAAAIAIASLVLAGPMLVLKPEILSAVGEVVDATLAKGDSDSYAIRSGADGAAMSTFGPTYGLGVGWGSFRASSLFPGLVANAGVFGVFMVFWLGVRLMRLASRAGEAFDGHSGQSLIGGFSASICGQLAAALLSSPTIGSLAFFLQLGCMIGASARMSFEAEASRAAARAAKAGNAAALGAGSAR